MFAWDKEFLTDCYGDAILTGSEVYYKGHKYDVGTDPSNDRFVIAGKLGRFYLNDVYHECISADGFSEGNFVEVSGVDKGTFIRYKDETMEEAIVQFGEDEELQLAVPTSLLVKLPNGKVEDNTNPIALCSRDKHSFAYIFKVQKDDLKIITKVEHTSFGFGPFQISSKLKNSGYRYSRVYKTDEGYQLTYYYSIFQKESLLSELFEKALSRSEKDEVTFATLDDAVNAVVSISNAEPIFQTRHYQPGIERNQDAIELMEALGDEMLIY